VDGRVRSNGGMLMTGENWSPGRNIFYRIWGTWLKVCGAMVKWYWQGKTEALGEESYKACVVDGWISVEQYWNKTDREKWSTGRKILFRKSGKWMNEFGAMVERYWQKKLHWAWVVVGSMSMEQWCNDTDIGKLNYWE